MTMHFVFIVVFLITVALYLKYKKWSKVNEQFLSPHGLPVLGHALQFKNSSDLIPLIQKYSSYGKIVLLRFGPLRKILISDCKMVEYILTTNIVMSKGHEYIPARSWLGNGLLTSNGDKEWKAHRKAISRTFHKDIYHYYISVFERNSNILVKQLRSELGKASFDISKFITLCSLDIISEAALGKSFNAQEDLESQYVSSLKIMCKMVMERSFNVFLFNDFLYSFTKLYQEEKEALRYLYSSFENIIKERHNLIYNQGNCDGSLTFLDFILEEKLKKQTFTHQAVHDNVQTMIFAGHDTTSSALNFTIYLLGDHPQVQQQVLDEYLTVMENKSEVLSISHLNQLKYLDAVIKESLRLYPPVPYISRAGSSFEYEGRTIPRNTSLLICIYGIHRSEEFYQDPEKFIPERFFNPSKVAGSYLPFSAGPRNCIGQKFAMFEMKYVLVTLLKHYEILPATPRHEPKLADEVVLVSLNGVRIAIRERKL